MAYLRSRIKAGDIIDTHNYHTARYKSEKRPREKNKSPTPASQKKTNENNSLKTLIYLIRENFKTDDLYLTLTYDKNTKTFTPANLKENVKKFLRNVRGLYKKHKGVLKYILMTEFEKCRPHHHILINNIGLSTKLIKKIWGNGFVTVKLFGGEIDDCERLANYFVKESNNTFNTKEKVHGLRWVPSKNLKHPEPVKKVVPASSWREDPKPIKGYYIAFVKRGWTESNYYSYPYMSYRMIKMPDGEEDESFRGDG